MNTAWTYSGTLPLKQRWDEAAARMLAAGHQPIFPITDVSWHRMSEFLQKNPPPAPYEPTPSAALLKAEREFQDVLGVYDQLVAQIAGYQKEIKRGSALKLCAALGIPVTESMLAVPPDRREMLFDLFKVRNPDFVDIANWRHAAQVVMAIRVHPLQDIASKLTVVMDVAKFLHEIWTDNKRLDVSLLILSLGARCNAAEARIEQLEKQLHELRRPKKPTTAKKGNRHG
jgi:hypothetical protein